MHGRRRRAPAEAGLIAIAAIRSLSGNTANHGISHSRPSAGGMTNATFQLTPSLTMSSDRMNDGAMTDPNCAPALNKPPARERVAGGNRPASALMPAV